MKKMISFVLLLVACCYMEGTAQQPGDSKPLASTHSFKARRELMHEKQVKRREHKLLAKNERHSRHKQKDTYSLKFGGAHKKRHHNKEKNKEKKGTATIDERQVKK